MSKKTNAKKKQPADYVAPTQEQLAKGNIKHNNKVYMATVQIPLDYYYNMKPGGINQTQFAAGCQLYELFRLTGIETPVTPSYSEPIGGGSRSFDSVTERQIHARRRYDQAVKSVAGTIGQSLVVSVCAHGYLLKDIPIPGYARPAERMARFREALNDLVAHFHTPIYYNDRKYYFEELKWE